MIKIKKLNELFIQIECERDITNEIYEKFSFFVPDHHFMPQFKHGQWDGKIRLFNRKTRTFPLGLLGDLIRWIKECEYEFDWDKALKLISFEKDLESFEENIIPNLELDPYEYQLKTFKKCIQLNRALVLSPTGSGKSFIIYLIIRFLLEQIEGKILISVPSTNLVRQMHLDFCDYEDDNFICEQCYEMASGHPKITSKRIVIATWSMLMRQDQEFFSSFEVFFCDESHQADSMALGKIISNLTHVPFRFGFTGTLDGSRVHELQCRSWFGSLIRSSSTKELMDQGILSPLKVECISLDYSDDERKLVKKLDYQNEIKFITEHKKRNEWLVDLAMSQDNNTLVLFNFVERHGEVLFEQAKKKAQEKGKQIFFIVGDVNVNEREEIRKVMEKHNNVILFASFGTMSVGVNIKNLHFLIFAHPFKARIRTLQSIGRTLRKLDSKTVSTIIDVIDNFCIGKHQNIVYKHRIATNEII